MKAVGIGAAALAMSLSLSASAGERQWYASVEGGANSSEIETRGSIFHMPTGGLLGLNPPLVPDLSSDVGWAMFASLGTKIAGNVRIEGEIGHRAAEFGGAGGIRHTTLMANALIDVPVLEQLTLSAGAGAGFDWIETDATPNPPFFMETSGTGFAFQGIAALSYAVAEHVDVTVSYRYLNASVPDELDATVVGAVVQVDDTSASTISIGLRFDL